MGTHNHVASHACVAAATFNVLPGHQQQHCCCSSYCDMHCSWLRTCRLGEDPKAGFGNGRRADGGGSMTARRGEGCAADHQEIEHVSNDPAQVSAGTGKACKCC